MLFSEKLPFSKNRVCFVKKKDGCYLVFLDTASVFVKYSFYLLFAVAKLFTFGVGNINMHDITPG